MSLEFCSTPRDDMIVIFRILCLSYFYFIVKDVAADAPDSLRLINVLYRHGDRSPTYNLKMPNDPHTEESWPQGWGQLSELGMSEQYNLGQWLRRRYNGFLNETYIAKEVYVRSTDLDRTLMSAYSNLAGLYVPQQSQLWNSNITWQPIPVHTTQQNIDWLMHSVCPKYDELLDEVRTSDAFLAVQNNNLELFEKLSFETGAQVSLSNIWSVFDTFFCEKLHNKSLPDWLDDNMFAKLEELSDLVMDFDFKLPEMAKLKGGPLLGEVSNHLTLKKNGKIDQRLFMYSGHDTTVAPFLKALGVFNHRIPPYTACAIVELHENTTGNFFVKVLYRNSSLFDGDDSSYLHDLTSFLPGCTEVTECPLDVFISHHKNMIPEDIEKECQVKGMLNKIVDSINPTNVGLAAVIVFVFILIVIMIATIAIKCKHRNEDFRRYTMFDSELGNEESAFINSDDNN